MSKWMKWLIVAFLIVLCAFAVHIALHIRQAVIQTVDKPVIYLFPKSETDVNIRLEYDGAITCSYPSYDEDRGWNVTAFPNGTLVDKNGITYSYLFWEGTPNWKINITSGFCVSGKDTASFLEDKLSYLGLTRDEANDFITYWLPRMQNNRYNLISFQTESYGSHAKLQIEPQPDTMLRVFMTWKSSSIPVSIPTQALKTNERAGFTVVEWGGTEIH